MIPEQVKLVTDSFRKVLPIAGVTADLFYDLSLSQTSSGWQLIENQAFLLWDEGSLQTYWLDNRRFAPVAGNARGRDLGVAAANNRCVCRKLHPRRLSSLDYAGSLWFTPEKVSFQYLSLRQRD
jgi:hypothetical protein